MAEPSAQPPKGLPPGDPRSHSSVSKLTLASRREPLPAEERETSERAKELAGELGFRLRSFAKEQVEDFRASDKYFKWKVLIVASWATVSLGSLFVAMSGPASVDQADNELGAYVRVDRTSLGWALLVENKTDDEWTVCKFVLNDSWVLEKKYIPGYEKLVLGPAQFRKDGKSPPKTEEPQSLQITCDEGEIRPPLAR